MVVMTDHYTTLTKAITSLKTNATTAARIFIEHWVTSYGISFNALTNEGFLVFSRFVVTMCRFPETNIMTTTKYIP